jgi:hypothetical protein
MDSPATIRRLAFVLLFAVPLAGACHRSPPTAPASLASPPRASLAALALPEVAGFEAAPPVTTDGYVHRRYTRGRTHIDVTLARFPMSPESYAGWVRTSTASFPQAALDLPPEEANGFYQCGEGTPPSCDLLIQLRAGFHLEIRGGGTTTAEDVDALARGLGLRALAGWG